MVQGLIMILNHLNLAVSDVQAAREFLVKYFGLDPQGKPGNDFIAFLRDDHGMVLTLSNLPKVSQVFIRRIFHIGFIQESPQKVDEINGRLRDVFRSRCTAKIHGSWTFYFIAPGGFHRSVGLGGGSESGWQKNIEQKDLAIRIWLPNQ